LSDARNLFISPHSGFSKPRVLIREFVANKAVGDWPWLLTFQTSKLLNPYTNRRIDTSTLALGSSLFTLAFGFNSCIRNKKKTPTPTAEKSSGGGS